MDKIEAMKLLQEINHYLTTGNPVWDVDEIAEALDMAIEALSKPKTEWIPISEALPSEGQVVLAIGDKGTWDVGKFQGTAGWTCDERMWNWKKKSVKLVEYWMPKDAIPLPNREDGEEE